MFDRWRIVYVVCAFVLGAATLNAQAPVPVPIPGGDVLGTPSQLFNQFFPGVGPIFDGRDADPQGITNFSGLIAMGYTTGTATDNLGRQYNVITDIRVYQGDYIGGVAILPAGGTKSAQAFGTFVEI